jgi:cell fate (sporulation/competence/biofilm development) regulator YlbF (YheA/YmcA/DUF963 family)
MTKRTFARKADVSQAVLALSATLKASPELAALQAAIQSVNTDHEAQAMLRQIRTLQTGLYWRQGDPTDALALRELQTSLEARPSIQSYYRAEQAVREMLQAVDAVISQAAGIDFAANAKTSCCGG